MKQSAKKKIKSLIKSSKLFMDQITDDMFIVDKNLIIQYINDSTLSVFGYSRDGGSGFDNQDEWRAETIRIYAMAECVQ